MKLRFYNAKILSAPDEEIDEGEVRTDGDTIVGVGDAEGAQLVGQHPRQIELALGGRMGPGGGIGGGVHLDILQKALIGTHGKAPFKGVFLPTRILHFARVYKGVTASREHTGTRRAQNGRGISVSQKRHAPGGTHFCPHTRDRNSFPLVSPWGQN